MDWIDLDQRTCPAVVESWGFYRERCSQFECQNISYCSNKTCLSNNDRWRRAPATAVTDACLQLRCVLIRRRIPTRHYTSGIARYIGSSPRSGSYKPAPHHDVGNRRLPRSNPARQVMWPSDREAISRERLLEVTQQLRPIFLCLVSGCPEPCFVSRSIGDPTLLLRLN